MLNYVQEIPVDTMIVGGTHIITRSGNQGAYEYSLGAVKYKHVYLRKQSTR